MRKVLVVDDDVAVLDVVIRWLIESKHEVLACHTVETAKICLDSWRPDVLLTDVRVEGDNGLYLAILASQRAPRVKVVVMSGFDDQMLKNEAKALNAVFLAKPLQHAKLLAATDG